MGSVDQTDLKISWYRVRMKGKKWCTPVLFWTLGVVFNKAYKIAWSCKFNVADLLKFRRQVVTFLLLQYGEDKTSTGLARRFISPRIIPDDAVWLMMSDYIILTQQWWRCEDYTNKTTRSKKIWFCSSSYIIPDISLMYFLPNIRNTLQWIKHLCTF